MQLPCLPVVDGGRPLRIGALLLGVALIAVARPALAGSSTAGSIISKADAIATASSAMPAGQVIMSEQCLTMVRDLSPRYRCTVTWGDPPASAAN